MILDRDNKYFKAIEPKISGSKKGFLVMGTIGYKYYIKVFKGKEKSQAFEYLTYIRTLRIS